MDYNQFKDCEVVMENEKIEARRHFSGEKNTLVEIRLQPGGTIAPHSTPESAFFYILEGKGVLSIGEESVGASAGVTAFCPADLDKGIRNEGDNLLRILVVKMDGI